MTQATDTTIHRPTWVDLATSDAEAARKALPFYREVLGWETRRSLMPGGPDYIEFQLGGESVAGAWDMSAQQMEGAPSQWMVYFAVDDADAAFRKVLDNGGHEVSAPQPYPGGKFAIVTDPQGAAFGLLEQEEGRA